MEGERGGEKRKRCFLLSPPPYPVIPVFCSHPNFPAELARLATQAICSGVGCIGYINLHLKDLGND